MGVADGQCRLLAQPTPSAPRWSARLATGGCQLRANSGDRVHAAGETATRSGSSQQRREVDSTSVPSEVLRTAHASRVGLAGEACVRRRLAGGNPHLAVGRRGPRVGAASAVLARGLWVRQGGNAPASALRSGLHRLAPRSRSLWPRHSCRPLRCIGAYANITAPLAVTSARREARFVSLESASVVFFVRVVRRTAGGQRPQ